MRMRHLLTGYWIFLGSFLASIAISILAHLMIGGAFLPGGEFLILSFSAPNAWRTVINAVVLVWQTCGILMYLRGYKSGDTMGRAQILILLCLPMIIWGIFVISSATTHYEYLLWLADFIERAPDLWDHLLHVTWALKGVIWIAGSIILMIASRKFFMKAEMNADQSDELSTNQSISN